MLAKRLLYIFSCLFCYVLTTVSQNLPYRLVNTIHLSPADECRWMMFDHGGLMWLGTSSGLKSWDGYDFQNFRSTAFSPGILPNNTVLSITEDNNKILWLGTRNGLARFDMKTRSFNTLFIEGDSYRTIYTLYTSTDGTVWIGTDGGLTRYDEKTHKFDTYTEKNSIYLDSDGKKSADRHISVKSIIDDGHGNLYLGTWSDGVLIFNPKKRTFQRYEKINNFNSAYSLYLDSKGRLWIGSWSEGLQMIPNPEQGPRAEHLNIPINATGFYTFYKIIEDPISHKIWASSREGICLIDPITLQANCYTYAGTNPIGLCYNLNIDNMGNIWAATFSGHIYQFASSPAIFQFSQLGNIKDPVNIGAVSSIYTADGTWFWLGVSPNGLVLYNKKDGKTLYNTDIPGFAELSNTGLSTRITSIIRRYNGQLWFATNSNGIMVKENGKAAEAIYSNPNSWLRDNVVNTLFEDHNKNLWVGQRTYLSFVRPDGSGEALVMKDENGNYPFCDVRGITEDKEGNIWAATENIGIIKVTPKKDGSFAFHRYYPENHKYAVEDATNCFIDSRNILWAISNSGGLFRYDTEKDCFEPVNKKYGIDGDKVFAISEDNYGHLWLNSDECIIRLIFDDKGKTFVTHFTEEDGVQNASFFPNSVFKYKDEMYFGANNGLISFIPKRDININDTSKRKLIVTDIIADGVSYTDLDSTERARISPIAPRYTRTIEVPSDIKRLSVEFSLLTYSSQARNKYAYKLEGYDNDWRYTDNYQRMASFENLSPGSYTLHLRACDNYGRWTELSYTIKLKVLPPWYLSWWAYATYIVLLILSIYGSIRWYRNHIKTKNRLQMAVVFTNITHELLTPLTVISATIDMLRQKAPGHDEQYGIMQNNINRLTRLLRQILEVRKSQAGQLKLKVRKQNIAEFIEAACDNIRPMAEARGIKLVFNYRDSSKIDVWFDADKMDKILYNLLSNAVKYSHENGQIVVELQLKQKTMIISVADQGIGISKEKLRHLYSRFLDGDYRRMNTVGTGIGLSLTHDLVVLHHGKIDCQSVEGEGTTFTIQIPTDKSAYSDEEIEYSELATSHRLNDVATTNNDDEAIGDIEVADGYTILVVEDNEELLSLMKQLLAQHFRVLTAKNGVQALNIIQKESLDLVISDVMMPQMDGIELTQRIKQSDDYGQLPVLLLTAKTRDEDRNKAYETGADQYMTKPFKLNELLVRVQSIIKNRERIRRKFSAQTEFVVEEQHYSNPDETFVQKAIECVKAHLDDADYDREGFASDMMVSSSTLYNKLRALTGQNISGFITSIRLKEACRIARRNPNISLTELSVRVGYNNPKYFSKCFKKEFGMTVKEYLQKEEGKREE